jgi:diaminopimelate decarboxylase
MSEIHELVRRTLREGVLDAAPHAAFLYDLDRARERIAELQAAFPAGTLHALAIKACPLSALLRFAADLGCGAEAASEVELRQALRVGIPPERIVFDSPAKTVEELRFAIASGVHLNADNLQELDRIAGLLGNSPGAAPSIGVRINPGIPAGSIEASSTATPGSKFGVSLADDADELLESVARHPWLRALHLHVGSQGCDLELLTEGVACVVEFATEVERRCGAGRIEVLDIGGGLPVAYRPGERAPGFGDYARALAERAPRLFSGEWRLVTEFGRAVWASAGLALSRVEYTKVSHGRRIAVAHLGADAFPRTAYLPETWPHELSVFDATGRPKEGEPITQDVAGPLCFSGDLLARDRLLPPIEPGDCVAIHDAGAYTLGMWSCYNSRLSPPVYGYSRDEEGLRLLRRAESPEDVLRFWD